MLVNHNLALIITLHTVNRPTTTMAHPPIVMTTHISHPLEAVPAVLIVAVVVAAPLEVACLCFLLAIHLLQALAAPSIVGVTISVKEVVDLQLVALLAAVDVSLISTIFVSVALSDSFNSINKMATKWFPPGRVPWGDALV